MTARHALLPLLSLLSGAGGCQERDRADLGPPAAAAQASGARELLTEDLNHGQDYGGVRVVNPFK